MAGQLLLVNPRRRHRRRKASHHRRRRSRASTIVVANPRRRRRHRRAHHRRRHVTVVASNPRRRYHMRRNPRRYRMRRNPLGLSSTRFSPVSAVIGGGVGALGAIGVNWIFGAVGQSLPSSIQQGTTFYPFLKAGAAVLVGYALGGLIGKRYAEAAAAGALTIIIYNNVAPQLQSSGVTLGRFVHMRGMRRRRMGRFVRMKGLARSGRRGMRGLGYMNPARVVRMRGLGRHIGVHGLGANLARFRAW